MDYSTHFRAILRRMVTRRTQTVAEYLKSLPPDRRAALEAVRRTIRENLPTGFEEDMQYGMISYSVPLSRYPTTYNGQPLALASLASQKQYMALYLMGCYGDPELSAWFQQAWRASGKKLDMGKSCVRFKSLGDLPLEVIGEAVARLSLDDFIALYERVKRKPKAGAKRAARSRASTPRRRG